MTVPSLSIQDLAFSYPDGHQALFGVTLDVAKGERVALLGPNGAGKTTLVLHLNGLLSGGTGVVEVAGLPVQRANYPEIRRRVGVVFQDPDDQLFMPTVHDDVAFGPANAGVSGRWRCGSTSTQSTCQPRAVSSSSVWRSSPGGTSSSRSQRRITYSG